MSKKSGLTLTMLIIYIVVLSVIMGAVIANLGANDKIDELDQVTYQARVQDYIEQFTSMKNYYKLKGEFDSNTTIKGNQTDAYGRSITDYISSISIEDKDYFCIKNGELHFYNLDTFDQRYGYLTELGLTHE